MHVLTSILSNIALIVGFGCGIIILIEAFKDEIWKGVFNAVLRTLRSVLCPLRIRARIQVADRHRCTRG